MELGNFFVKKNNTILTVEEAVKLVEFLKVNEYKSLDLTEGNHDI